ncbi:MAG: prolipoprotein diacylglyceryl transferase [Planctomycetota bacterium]|jgi:phosphatidylglycerol:prolipoprotein diacylglycerol transferase
MHPILFELPVVGLPVRMFGLFIIDAFFLATMWAQWRYATLRAPEIREDVGLAKSFRLMIGGAVVSRVLWLGMPGVSWPTRVLAVLLVDIALEVYAWTRWSKAQKLSEKTREEADFMFNLAFWLLVVGFVGSRIFWIITTPAGQRTFTESPLRALVAVWDGGIVYYGGLLCAAAFGAWFLWWKNRNILEVGDVIGLGVALTLFIGRWACFSAGDDFGEPTDLPWGVVFPVDENSQIPDGNPFTEPDWQGKVALHPTQLYMSLNGLIIFLILSPVLARKRFDGQVFYLFLMLYAVGRSAVELFRGDEGRGLYEIGESMKLSSSQLISIPVFVLALYLYLRASAKARRARAESTPPEGDAAG